MAASGDQIDCAAADGVDAAKVAELARGDWLERALLIDVGRMLAMIAP
jgi:hypothetical protein